ncbi:MAG: glycosyltransferase [Pseudomonadota bacterium]
MKALIPNFENVLIISPEPWDGHFVSKHHYAVTLAGAGSHVYFLNPPNKSSQQIEIKPTKYTGLWEIDAPQVKKGLRFYPAFIRRRLEQKWLRVIEKLIVKEFTTVWLFENSRFYDMKFAGNRLKIYHQVDLNQNFHEIAAAKTADLVLCTTDIIKEHLAPHCQCIYKQHHAVSMYDMKLLDKRYSCLIDKEKVNAAYIGNLKMGYLDVELLSNVVKDFPQVDFHFVGTCSKNEPLYIECKDCINIKWWGRVDSSVIPSILDNVDVLLLTYQEAHFQDQASPHKVMEYLASGKVTVATYTDEYKDKRHLLEMVDHNNDFMERFDAVINNLSGYNSPERQKERKLFAQKHTYEKQLKKIVSYLKQEKLLK